MFVGNGNHIAVSDATNLDELHAPSIYVDILDGQGRPGPISTSMPTPEPIAELEHGCSPFGLATEAPLLTMGPHYRQHAGVRQSLNQPRHERSVVIHGLTLGSCEQRASSAWELGLHDGDPVIDALISRLADQNEDTAVLMEVVAALDRIRSWRSREALLLFGSRTDPATIHEERCRLRALRAVARLDREIVA